MPPWLVPPQGRNVMIEQAYGGPKITKDGVTVAKVGHGPRPRVRWSQMAAPFRTAVPGMHGWKGEKGYNAQGAARGVLLLPGQACQLHGGARKGGWRVAADQRLRDGVAAAHAGRRRRAQT